MPGGALKFTSYPWEELGRHRFNTPGHNIGVRATICPVRRVVSSPGPVPHRASFPDLDSQL